MANSIHKIDFFFLQLINWGVVIEHVADLFDFFLNTNSLEGKHKFWAG